MMGWSAILLVLKGFWGKYSDKIIIGVIVLAASGLAYGMIVNYGKGKYEAGKNEVQVILERERAESAAKSLAEARRRQQITQEAQDAEDAVRAKAEQEKAALRALVVKHERSIGLLDAAISDYARAGFVRASAGGSCGDLPVRLETLGLVAREGERAAGECEAEIERLGAVFRLCRDHSKVVDDFRKAAK